MPTADFTGTRRRRRTRGWGFHAVMAPVALVWVAPMIFVFLVALRSFSDITMHGLGSLPRSFTFEGFVTAFQDGLGGGSAIWNSVVVTVATVFFQLLLASWAAYALCRRQIPGSRALLLLMLAGNLLPPQILLIPVSRITDSLGISDTLFALIIVQVGFGLGFFTFVLHGFMSNIPGEILEAARVDGAGELRCYWQIVMPLCRPSIAALSALGATWVWNDLIWALTVLRSETKFPITAALLNIQGTYVSQWNNVAAGAIIAAIPMAVIFFVFQKQFVSGLAIGSGK